MTQNEQTLFVSLYLDEDVSRKIAELLREKGYNAVSTYEVSLDKNIDEEQLRYATDHQMTILTYNRDDFLEIDKQWHAAQRAHYGILISEQFSSRQTGEFMPA